MADTALGANYTLVERHGRGAMGEVWVAEDRRTGERVAAKILHAELAGDAELVGRFVRERSILTGLRHANVVTVRDMVVEGDRLAIVMDLVDGGTLRDVLERRGTLPPQQAVAVAAAVASGLAAAHAQQVVHRDIKPDNVLLRRDWESLADGSLRLSDFGISRIVEGATPATRGLLGTPEYIAPEILVTGHADLPADVYALGVLLYELLAGRTPFAGPGTDYTVAHRHVSNEVPPLDLPQPLQQVLDDLLGKDPAARPSAATTQRRLSALAPTLGGVAALPAQAAPESFAAQERPATVVKARATDPRPEPDEPVPSSVAHAPIDLGPSGSETIVRAQPVRPMPTPRAAEEPGSSGQSTRRPAWRDPRLLAIVSAGVALVVVAVLVVSGGGEDEAPPAAGGGPVQASQQDQPLPTGLGVQRAASYDVERGVAELTITYSAQAGVLAGPFLEVLPGDVGAGGCAQVTWVDGDQTRNLPTTTGVTADCGWAVDPGPVAPRDAVQVRAEVQLDLPEPTSEALQQWLDEAVGTTSSVVADPQVSSSSYAAQRLQDVQVVAPSSVPVGDPVDLVLLPVWPGGPDELNPLFRSPAGAGEPSAVLVGVAGGDEGVRFVDGCSGALAVSSDRRTVTARSAASDCRVDAQVGNFTALASNEFSVVARSDG